MGSHFDSLEKNNQERLTVRAIRVIGTNIIRSGENWPKILFSFRVIYFWLMSLFGFLSGRF